MSKTARVLLNADPLVNQNRRVRVPEIMNPYMRKPSRRRICSVLVLDGRITKAPIASAYAIFVPIDTVRYKNGLVLLQYIHQVLRHLKIPIGGLILRRRLHIITLQFLRHAAPHMKDIPIDVRPPERVDLTLAHPCVERYREKYIIPPVRILFRFSYKPMVLLRRVVV